MSDANFVPQKPVQPLSEPGPLHSGGQPQALGGANVAHSPQVAADAPRRWRRFGELLRQRRQDARPRPKAAETAFETDQLELETPADPILLGLQHYLSLVSQPIPAPLIQECHSPATDAQRDRWRVADWMSRRVICVLASTTVEQAASLCNRHGFSGVPVVDEAYRLQGIITLSDIMRQLLAHPAVATFAPIGGELLGQQALALLDEPVRAFMQTRVLTVSPDTSVQDACRRLRDHRIRRLVVVEGEIIQGIFSARDAVDVLAEVGPGARPDATM